jgi:hypothetical protein
MFIRDIVTLPFEKVTGDYELSPSKENWMDLGRELTTNSQLLSANSLPFNKKEPPGCGPGELPPEEVSDTESGLL